MSHAKAVTDPISAALQRRCAQVAAAEAAKHELERLLARKPTLDHHLLIGLLAETWQRLPDDLTLVSEDDEQLNELLAIGAKVGDVLEVYTETLEESS